MTMKKDSKRLLPLRWAARLIPHLCIAMSVSLLVFIVIDHFNNAMGFLEGDVFYTYLMIYIFVTTATAGTLLYERSKH